MATEVCPINAMHVLWLIDYITGDAVLAVAVSF